MRGAQASNEHALINYIISERDDHVTRVEPHDYVTRAIVFGNPAYI